MQQVAQLVERPIEVVEYQRHSCECRRCGQMHTAEWPQTIVPGQDLGVSLQALLVWLGNYGHLSYEKQQELLQELGGIDIGVGTLQATNTRVYEAIAPSVSQLREWVQMQLIVHVDETRKASPGSQRVAVGECRGRILPVSCRRYSQRVPNWSNS